MLLLVSLDVSNVISQEAASTTSAYTQPSLPVGFFPNYADRQTYASQKVQRLTNNPGYFTNHPDQIAEALAYLEFMIDRITRPINYQIGPEERQQYLELRTTMRANIGIEPNESPSVAIAALYAVSKIDPKTLKQGVVTNDIGSMLEKQGLSAEDVLSLTEVFDEAGFEVENIFSVGDAVSEVVSATGLDGGVADAIVDALGLDGTESFADAVAAFNATFGTSYSVDQAKDALGIGDDEQEAGN